MTKKAGVAAAVARINAKVSNLTGMHPGSKARPFLRPAFEATKAQVAQILAEEIGKGLAELAKG